MIKGSGARYNQGKPAYSLIPLIALRDCARVFMYGCSKYEVWNWAKGMNWMIPYDCMMRHMEAWHRREENDSESGLPHLGHAMCNLVMLSFFAIFYRRGDDRPPAEVFMIEPVNEKRGEPDAFDDEDDFNEQFDELHRRLLEEAKEKAKSASGIT
jgi:hypothetical protein